MNWDAVTAIATVISMVAFVATAIYIRAELKAQEKDRFLTVTNELFTIWQSREFMEAQLWLLHRLEASTWEEFVKTHRADYGETAFHRVGSFYDRVGTLVRLGLVDEQEILSTIAAHAIAVWQKVEPLVQEARRIENSVLFDDFERLLPSCHECYVPSLGPSGKVAPFSLVQLPERISVSDLRRLGDAALLVDVRRQEQVAQEGPEPEALHLAPNTIQDHYQELPKERELVVFCSCPNEDTSIRVVRFLRGQGYRARALVGGTEALRAGRAARTPARV
jgi:rhodanese-related sulfurtransferase